MSEETKGTNKKFIIRNRAVIVHNNELLVVKHSHGNDFYALPGGHMEWAENIHDALKREIVEEFGIEPQIGRLLYINNFVEGDIKQSIEFFFEVTNSKDYLDTENLGGTHKHELAEICWINKDTEKCLLPEQLQKYLKNENLLSDIVRFL